MPLAFHMTLGWILVIATLAMVGFWVPPSEAVIGSSYLIFFFHFPSAVNCLNLFVLAAFISAFHLARRTPSSDHWAASGIEVGVLACSVTLATGMFWARAAWGIWWDVKDARLMSVAIMWLTYLGYLALRETIDEPVRRARFCAVFGAIAGLNVPIVYYAIKMFGKSSHPMEVVMNDPAMVATRWFGAAAFLVLYTAFWRLRYRVHAERHQMHTLEEGFARAGI